MFTDYVKIYATAGKGGNGAISFRHEKYVAAGRPRRRYGGKGGNVYFRVDKNANTLVEFRYQKKFRQKMVKMDKELENTGKAEKIYILNVPIGTIVKDPKYKMKY